MKKNNKKIALFMLPPLTLGCGAEKYFINLARSLGQRGMEADIITMDEKFYKKFARALHIFFSLNFFRPIDIKGKETEESVRQNLGPARWRKSSLKNLRQILNSYDIIYAKNEIVDLLILKLIGYKNLPPIIVGVHTPIFYPSAASWPAKLHNFLYQGLVYKWLLKKTFQIHVANKFTHELIAKKFNLKSELIYYPFSVAEFKLAGQENKSGIEFDKNKINIAFIARLSEQKGLAVLIKIIHNLANDKILSDKIRLNIFGRGDQKTEQLFHEFAEKYDWLRYFGHLENKFIPDVLSRQNLFISPAKWETMPYNILEAQAAGLPVIAFDISGPNDIIVDDETGWLVKNDSEFYNKIVEFAQQDNGLNKEKIIQHLREKFNQDKIYDEIVKLLTLIRG